MSTYTPIASITLASAASSVTFSGIPQTYTDLVVVLNGKNSTQFDNWRLTFNDDTASNYSYTYLVGNGSSASSSRGANATPAYIGGLPSSDFGTDIAHINNYSNTTTFKTVISRGSSATNEASAWVNTWRSTSAITKIKIDTGVGNFVSGSTFNLYGVANASITNVAKATGGDSVYTDGTYWYHIFRSSGTFTPTQALTADYLVVAGGGGAYGGGGGAGGLRSTVTATGGGGSLESALSLTAQAYTVTVGAGGAESTSGSNSVFSTITSTGGGRGENPGASGGSGGGGRRLSTANLRAGGAGTANQGFAGGNGDASDNANAGGGGGGGAGAAGTNASGFTGGNGGNGVAVSITGSSVTYAGGGGGNGTTPGSGGTGGGGAGGNTSGNTAGTANTGSGGGGGWNMGASGGSGIVIVRYAA